MISTLIGFFYFLLFFFTPLIVIPVNSELFEFGKMVFVYTITILVMALWAIKSVYLKKIIFRKTPLNLPIIIFVFSQIISTYVSIDPATSIFGYYSRFNGGLLSTLSYAILYFAFVSNVDKKGAIKSLYFLLASSLPVSFYAVLEHFGVDKNLWVQDVRERVFSTLGQPNWLAAYLVALMPVSWAIALERKSFYPYTLILFLALLFTKSRSGFLAFGIGFLIFLTANLRKHLRLFLIFLLTLAIGGYLFYPRSAPETNNQGGTESGDIRKIVWKGAIDTWRAYPVFGSGVETFAYSFYQYRPEEHNLVSEWDFLYNKAHNEYLNYLSTTGLFGLATYLVLISSSVFQILKIKNQKSKIKSSLFAGYVSILITNFFGFSVVAVSLLFFLFPAIAFSLNEINV